MRLVNILRQPATNVVSTKLLATELSTMLKAEDKDFVEIQRKLASLKSRLLGGSAQSTAAMDAEFEISKATLELTQVLKGHFDHSRSALVVEVMASKKYRDLLPNAVKQVWENCSNADVVCQKLASCKIASSSPETTEYALTADTVKAIESFQEVSHCPLTNTAWCGALSPPALHSGPVMVSICITPPTTNQGMVRPWAGGCLHWANSGGDYGMPTYNMLAAARSSPIHPLYNNCRDE